MELKFEVEHNTALDEDIMECLYEDEHGVIRVRDGAAGAVANLMMEKHGVISVDADGETVIHNRGLSESLLAAGPEEALNTMVKMLHWELPGAVQLSDTEMQRAADVEQSNRDVDILLEHGTPPDEVMQKAGFVYDEDDEQWVRAGHVGKQGFSNDTRDKLDQTDPDALIKESNRILAEALDLDEDDLKAGFLPTVDESLAPNL